ncbi:MAG: SPOR domain-containing protein [Hyphomonadaceae bacterium]
MARYHHSAYDDAPQPPYRLFMYVLMLVIAGAFAGFVWNWYNGGETPIIRAPAGAYKVAPPEDMNAPDPVEQNALYESLEGRDAGAEATPRPEPEAPAEEPPPGAGPPQLSPMPQFTSNGPFVAQVAALQSEAAVDPAWRRLSSRAPELFARARLDVERADLGARGIYFRVRAGYFANRDNATRFCDRIRQMGQDCIVVAR